MSDAASTRMTIFTSRRIRLGTPRADAAALVIVMIVAGGPALFTRSGFAPDFTNHLWLVWVQEQAISHHLAPTYFVNAPAVGVFYPFFVFYGGTLYAAAGALAALLGGHVSVAFVGAILLAVAASYGSLVWLGRQLGVRTWMAHAPAVAFVASAYYVTNLYGRGAWTEFMATSVIPLLIASGWRLIAGRRIEPLSAVLFVVAAVLFAGSHNVTLVLGALVLIVGLVLLWLGLRRKLMPHGPRRMLAVAGLLLLGFAVNGWFLVPDVVHASQTAIGASPLFPWSATGFFNTPGILFNPLRAVPTQSTTPALFVQAPDWFLLWVAVAGGALWSRTHRRLRRAGVALGALLGGLLALIMIQPLWDSLPRTLREVQLPYRLNTYVALCAAALVLVCVLAVERAQSRRVGRRLSAGLASVSLISIALCVWQLYVPKVVAPISYANRHDVFVSTHLTPRTWYDPGNYSDVSEPLITRPLTTLSIDPALVNADTSSMVVTPPSGTIPFATNVRGGPYVVAIGGGAARVGRTPGYTAVARRRKPGGGPITLTLSASGGALIVGRWISYVAIAVLWILACYAFGIRLWKR